MHIRFLLLLSCLLLPFAAGLAQIGNTDSHRFPVCEDVKSAPSDSGESMPTTIRFKAGNGITRPNLIRKVEPVYSEAARQQRIEGIVVPNLIVDKSGSPRNICTRRSLRDDLDQNAAKAASQWLFEPSRKDGEPVSVLISVEVAFRLYRSPEQN